VVFSFVKFEQERHMVEAIVDMALQFVDAPIEISLRVIDSFTHVADATVRVKHHANGNHDADCNREDLDIGQLVFSCRMMSGLSL
jgi:hypothetical protein